MQRVTPDVRRNLNRSVASLFLSAGSVAHAVGYVASAVGWWCGHRAAIHEARADVEDPDAVAELRGEQ